MPYYTGIAPLVGETGGIPGSTGFVGASAGANVNDGGSTAWTNPGNILLSDNVRATCNRSSTGTSQLLYATFDLSSVPDTATITGVRVILERDYSSTGTSSVRDHTIRLTKDGSAMVGDNKADTGTDWVKGDTEITYGATTDLWGTTLTPAEVKAATFGVMIKAEFVTLTVSTTARVDHIEIAIDYVD